MCLFCSIAARETDAELVFEDEISIGFLDHRPVFKGHTLVVPKRHFETLADLPEDLVGRLFANVRVLSRAVPSALGGDGSFVAINNVVSQSVPHLHVHVVPRKKKDGLRGFFWPRQKYADAAERRRYAEAIRNELQR